MDFIRKLLTMAGRIVDFVRDGHRRHDLPQIAGDRDALGHTAGAPVPLTRGDYAFTRDAPEERRLVIASGDAPEEGTAQGVAAIRRWFGGGLPSAHADPVDLSPENAAVIALDNGAERELLEDGTDTLDLLECDGSTVLIPERESMAVPPGCDGPTAISKPPSQTLPDAPTDAQTLTRPGIRLRGTMDAHMYAEFTRQLSVQAPDRSIVIALTTRQGDPEIARTIAEDIRLLHERDGREIVFLGDAAVHGAGLLVMAAFPVDRRYLTENTELLIAEAHAPRIEVASGPLRDAAERLGRAQRDLRDAIEREDADYRALGEGSRVSAGNLRERAAQGRAITASEAVAMGLVAGVV